MIQAEPFESDQPIHWQDPDVEWVYSQYPVDVRSKCIVIRSMIFEAAKKDPRIGPILETLRWGEPAYIPRQTKSGAMVRVHWKASVPDQIGLYFLCQTDLVRRFKSKFGSTLNIEGNRAIVLDRYDDLPSDKIVACVLDSFCYYLDPKETKD